MTRNLSKTVNQKSRLNSLIQEKDKKRVSGSFNPEFPICKRRQREEIEKTADPGSRIRAQDEMARKNARKCKQSVTESGRPSRTPA